MTGLGKPPNRTGRTLEHQTCKLCGRRDKVNFNVAESVWSSVVPTRLRNRVVCLNCFDDLAKEKGIDYSQSLGSLFFAGEQAVFQLGVVKASNVYDACPIDSCRFSLLQGIRRRVLR